MTMMMMMMMMMMILMILTIMIGSWYFPFGGPGPFFFGQSCKLQGISPLFGRKFRSHSLTARRFFFSVNVSWILRASDQGERMQRSVKCQLSPFQSPLDRAYVHPFLRKKNMRQGYLIILSFLERFMYWAPATKKCHMFLYTASMKDLYNGFLSGSTPFKPNQNWSTFFQLQPVYLSDFIWQCHQPKSNFLTSCAWLCKQSERFLVSESFPCKYRVRQARASRIMVLTRINSSWTDPGCQVFQPPFRPLNRAPNIPSPRKGKHRGKHRTSTVLTCQGRCLYTNIYIYINKHE